jgi:hypothetical protein
MNLRLLLLLLALTPGLRAAGPDEKLAGEDTAAPTAVPTPAGDERGPVQVTRRAQVAPSFDLPAFVVTGSGERQALAHRQDLGGSLDTSGGFKTSPGEQGAGKDQLAAQGGRESLEDLSSTSKPFVGGARLAGGYQTSYAGSGYLAQELGPWSWSLDGDAAATVGGPRQSGMQDEARSDHGGLRARAGWRRADGLAVNAFGQGAFATRVPEPYLAGQTDALKQGLWEGGVDLSSGRGALQWRGQVRGGEASAQALGADLSEGLAGLDLSLGERFSGRTGSAALQLDLGVDSSSLTAPGLRSTRQLLRAALTSHFEAGHNAHLGLGLGLDTAVGDDSALQLGPRLRWDQGLGAGLSLQVRLDSGLRLSRLRRPDTALEPWHLPNPTLKPARLALDGAADLNWQKESWSFSAGAFAQQGEDWWLPAATAGSVVAVDTEVRGWRLNGVRAGLGWSQGPWSSGAEARWQWAQLPDLDALPTFIPAWSAQAHLGYQAGPWRSRLSLDWTGPRQAALDGSLPLDPSAELSALLAYDLDEAWTFFAEGRNLASQTVEPAPFYPDAAPYVGLGAELRF